MDFAPPALHGYDQAEDRKPAEEASFDLHLVKPVGGKAISPTVSGQKGLPLLPAANNGSLLITD